MSKPLVYAPDAIIDLEEITDFIALQNPERALTFVAELEAKAARAAEHPEAYHLREELAPGLRSTIHKAYVVFFRELEDQVRIVHVVHGRRDFERMTFD